MEKINILDLVDENEVVNEELLKKVEFIDYVNEGLVQESIRTVVPTVVDGYSEAGGLVNKNISKMVKLTLFFTLYSNVKTSDSIIVDYNILNKTKLLKEVKESKDIKDTFDGFTETFNNELDYEIEKYSVKSQLQRILVKHSVGTDSVFDSLAKLVDRIDEKELSDKLIPLAEKIVDKIPKISTTDILKLMKK